MLWVVQGDLGSGKTLFCVSMLWELSRMMPIVSNISLNFNYEPLNLEKLIRCEYEDCAILVDEAYTLLDSRSSATTRNRLLSYVLLQSRKKSVHLIFTLQIFGSLDVRFRTLVGCLVTAQRVKSGFSYTLEYSTGKRSRKKLPYQHASQHLFGLYNTDEIVSADGLEKDILAFKSHSSQKSAIDSIVDDILDRYAHLPRNKITKGLIEIYFFEHNLDKRTLPLVFNYVKHGGSVLEDLDEKKA